MTTELFQYGGICPREYPLIINKIFFFIWKVFSNNITLVIFESKLLWLSLIFFIFLVMHFH